MASDIFALLDQHGVEKAVVVGHSMGGKVAAGACVRGYVCMYVCVILVWKSRPAIPLCPSLSLCLHQAPITDPTPVHTTNIQTAAALSTPERVAGLVVMDIAPVTYSITDGTNWQDTHKVGFGGWGVDV